MFLDDVLNLPILDLPFDNKCVLITLNVINLWFDVLECSDCLVRFIFEDIWKVHHIVISTSRFEGRIELLPGDQAEHHRAKQVENFLFGESILLAVSWLYQRDIHPGPLQQEFGHFCIYVLELLLILGEQRRKMCGHMFFSCMLSHQQTAIFKLSNSLDYLFSFKFLLS